jgi:hypothetical protein
MADNVYHYPWSQITQSLLLDTRHYFLTFEIPHLEPEFHILHFNMGFRDISHHFGLGMVLHGALGDDHCSNVSFLSTFLIFSGNCLHMLYESRTQFSHDIFFTFACLHILAGLLARSFSFPYSFLLIPDHFFGSFCFHFTSTSTSISTGHDPIQYHYFHYTQSSYPNTNTTKIPAAPV